jgi:heavy metal sensor kinase
MRSLRLSLTLYFLALLSLAVGAASWLVYRTAQGTLEAKKQATEQLIQTQYRERCREKEARLDDSLYLQAQTLASQVRLQRSEEIRQRAHGLHVFGAVSAAVVPNGWALIPLWVNESVWGWLNFQVVRPDMTRIVYDEDHPVRQGDRSSDTPPAPEYFQIDFEGGNSYASRSLAGRTLAIDTKRFGEDVLHHEYDTLELEPGRRIRRVVLKMPSTTLLPWIRSRRGTATEPTPLPAISSLYIQVATDLTPLKDDLLWLRKTFDADLAALQSETDASLASLRLRLLLIYGGIFAAAALGCLLLVRFGLKPLARVSDAVSKVTPRDFRLPLEENRLPVELRPIVARLTETLELLKRSFDREKQATADISHELRTPLAALLTTTEIALRKPRSADEYRELLQDCRGSALDMNRAVERLLTLARLDAGVERLKPQPLDAARVAEQCAAVVRPLAEARGLVLTVHDEGPAPLVADPDKLRDVVTNLLHNAVQYNRPQGSIEVSVHRDNGHLEVAVSDTGIGISAEARPRIFERFYRADPSRGGDGLHAGLGLAIVKEYVDLMGGTVVVESQEGQGSTFRVRLPA